MEERKKQQFLRTQLSSAFALTAVGLVFRTTSIGFKIYLSGVIGATGMGLYQLIFSVFIFGCTLANSGVGLGVTQLCAAAMAKGQHGALPQIIRRASTVAAAYGTLTSVVLYFFAPQIGVLLGNTMVVAPLRALAPGLFFVAIGSCLQGYFYAGDQIIKGMGSSLLVRIGKMGGTFLLFTLYPPTGIADACLKVCIASTAGEMMAVVFLMFLYRRTQRGYSALPGGQCGDAIPHLTGSLMKIAVPIALGSYLQSGFHTLEDVLIPQGLQASGVQASTALAQYGVIGGMVMPLLGYPAALLSSFSVLLVPLVVKMHTLKQKNRVITVSTTIVRFTLLFSFFVTAAFLFFSENFAAVFTSTDGTAQFLQVLAPLVPLIFLDYANDCLLKGLQQQSALLTHNIVHTVLTGLLLIILLPRFGIQGYISTLYITSAFSCISGLHLLLKKSGMPFHFFHWVIKPLCAAVGCCLIVRMFSNSFFPNQTGILYLIPALGVAGLLYLGVCTLLRCAGTGQLRDLVRLIFKKI